MKSLLKAVLMQLFVFPFLWIAGWFVLPVMIPFRKTDESTRKPYTQYPELGEYVFSNVPGWWGNPFDGLIGDKRGEFAKWCADRGIKPGGFLAMLIWSALRNPCNYWSRLVVGIDMSFATVVKIFGDAVMVEKEGVYCVQFLCATDANGKEFCRLFICLPWLFRPDKAFMLDIGWKVKLTHNGTTDQSEPSARYKGHVCTVSPWKGV